MENIMYFNNGVGPSSSIGIPLTQDEAEKRALPQYQYRLDGNDINRKRKSNGKNERICTNTMPYNYFEHWVNNDIIKEDRNITMIKLYRSFEVMGLWTFLLLVDGHTRQTFRAAKSEKIRIAESDSDDEEDYVIKRNDMGTPIHNSRPIGYQNNTNPAENMTLSTLESVINPFRKISVWKKAIGIQHKRSRNVETIEEALLLDVHHEFLEWSGGSREAKSRYNTRFVILLPKLIYLPQIVDWQLLHKIGYGEEIYNMLKISLKEAETREEIFFFVTWVRAFNIREPIYPELCRKFYATYEFDEVCADDELQSKKIISFRLGGRAHSLTLLEFARRLGLYHADELEEEGFDTYFQGGLRSDEKFNAREYWERISTNKDLHLSRSSITFVRFLILRVLHKMINYGLCQRTDRYEKIQRNDLWELEVNQICCGQFISKIARKSRVLIEEIVRTLSTPVYCRDLDMTTLRELIDSEDRLIPDIPVDDVPRVPSQRAPRVQRASMHDLYERMGSMEIRQETIKRMEYRQAYHWDRYQGIFEHMAGVYNVPL
ncbi:hypothetical protein Tco_0462639 [Tanacetum coccineum]